MTNLLQNTGKLLIAVLLLCLLIAVAAFAGYWLGVQRATPTRVSSIAPTVTQLERVGELSSLRVHVADVLTADGEGHRGCWLIKGDAMLSCAVSKATVSNVNGSAHTATILLPALRVTSARVDHEKTKTWSIEKSTWLPWKWGDQGVLRDAAMFHAQQLVESAASSERHLASAKTHTELLIRKMYDLTGWDVAVEWE